MRIVLAGVLAVIAVGGLVACGGGGDSNSEVEDTAITFVEAVDDENAEEACAMFSEEAAGVSRRAANSPARSSSFPN